MASRVIASLPSKLKHQIEAVTMEDLYQNLQMIDKNIGLLTKEVSFVKNEVSNMKIDMAVGDEKRDEILRVTNANYDNIILINKERDREKGFLDAIKWVLGFIGALFIASIGWIIEKYGTH